MRTNDSDPVNVKAIVDWPAPVNLKDFKKWLGLANYLPKYSNNYADMARPRSNRLKKDVTWCWDTEQEAALEAIKENLSLKAAEKNYSLHDKELLEMKYALGSLVWLEDICGLNRSRFVAYCDSVASPFPENGLLYNFEVKPKPGKQNALADALSRRPDYELAHVTSVTLSITELVRAAYAHGDVCVVLLHALESVGFKDSDVELSARFHRNFIDGSLLHYSTDHEDTRRVVVPHDEELKYRILYETHDSLVADPFDREKTYSSVSRHYWCLKLYKWSKTYVSTCETCQRVKLSPHSSAPLANLFVPSGCWQSMSMDFVFDLPKDSDGNIGVVIFVDQLDKMIQLAVGRDNTEGKGTASLFLDRMFANTDSLNGQTERVTCVVKDILRSTCAETAKRWSAMLPLVKFALNIAVHASTGFTPFYVNSLRHLRMPLTPSRRDSGLDGGESDWLEDISPAALRKQVDDFLSARLSVLHHVRDAMAESQHVQKEQADARGRAFKTKLRHRFIGPFTAVAKEVLAYTLNLPSKMRTHAVFYVGLLKRYRDPSSKGLAPAKNKTPDAIDTEPGHWQLGADSPFAEDTQSESSIPLDRQPEAEDTRGPTCPAGHEGSLRRRSTSMGSTTTF
ncbi:Retrotransposon Polyprotein [Phytophthora megakarya]|uniref:Retrotransposon Polyprotein n=1 Tax=Phytophthora megakarya TaxID=4795 RepID=A0A225VX75_9STRA|nr:Retrotransposon Polyprotein [Phytophthora megakarya]